MSEHESGSEFNRKKIHKAAKKYLENRDILGLQSFMPDENLPFVRDRENAKKSADAIMKNILSESLLKQEQKNKLQILQPVKNRKKWQNISGLAAAALLIAVLSSALTFFFIRANPTVYVRFMLYAPEASSVWLAADFNDWSPNGYELYKTPDGNWEITVPLRKGKAYTYNFIIDGEHWIIDPRSPAILDDGLGGSSSSLSL